MRAVVTGMVATFPVGGVVWDYCQYALGLQRLGFEVYYLEDAGCPSYDPEAGEYTEDCAYGVRFLEDSLTLLSPPLARRWHYRDMHGQTYGMAPEALAEVVQGADLFLNVSGGTLLRDEYMACPRKVLIDTDPGWNHFVNYPRWDDEPGWQGTHGFRGHDFFFTYAERIGREGCLLPTLGLAWQPTRPPVVLDRWHSQPPGQTWTTVMTWNTYRQPIEHNGVTYGSKEMEFTAIEPLPSFVSEPMEVALSGPGAPHGRLRDLGWSTVDSHAVSATADAYRSYVQSSRGEFSVAKNVYAATRCGWSSCRSVCYLAAGRPVVVQDTGFSEFIPTGHGLFAFSSLEEAVQGLTAVAGDYEYHQDAARRVARTHFGSDGVLGELLERIGLG